MALLWIEGFEGFGETLNAAPSPAGIVGRKYSSVAFESSMKTTAGRISGKSLQMENTNCYFQKTLGSTDDTITVGFAYMAGALLTQGYGPTFYDGANAGMRLYFDTDGKIAVYRNVTRLATSTQSISAGVWYYIEFKVKTNDTTGTYELRVNETTWLSATSVDTQIGSNPYYTAWRWRNPYSFVTCLFDDAYICDGSGSINNDFLGNRKVVALRPSGAGDNTDWTPSAGDNYAAVDEVELDEDTTYVESSTVTSDQDLYDYDALADVTNIQGIQINTDVRVTDAQSYDLNSVIKSGSTTDEGSADTITATGYSTNTRVRETDPNTSAAWTLLNVNAAQFGIKAT